MRFRLIDRITELREGEAVSAVKKLTGDEEYLQDHFPLFPVMPGVLMLEALFQASAWLVRASENFASSMVLLKEVRNAKFQGFIQPGQELLVRSEVTKQEDNTTTLAANGSVDGNTTVNARLVIERFNLADRFPSRARTDHYTRRRMREEFARLYAGQSVSTVG